MKIWFAYAALSKNIRYSIAVLWTIVIFIGCSAKGHDLPKIKVFDHFDKLVHFIFFFLFFFFWISIYSRKWMLLSIAMFYGFGLEVYQHNFVSGRSFDAWDAVADTVGALAALLFFNKIAQLKYDG